MRGRGAWVVGVLCLLLGVGLGYAIFHPRPQEVEWPRWSSLEGEFHAKYEAGIVDILRGYEYRQAADILAARRRIARELSVPPGMRSAHKQLLGALLQIADALKQYDRSEENLKKLPPSQRWPQHEADERELAKAYEDADTLLVRWWALMYMVDRVESRVPSINPYTLPQWLADNPDAFATLPPLVTTGPLPPAK